MRRAAAALLLAFAAAGAQAGRPCDEKPLTTQQVEQGLSLAQATARSLDANGAQLVILARAGQDLSQYGLRWSHFGLAYKDPQTQVWRVLHKLNHCGTAESAVYRQGLGEFFLDRPYRYDAAFAVPTPELQARLLAIVSDNAAAVRMHERRYSMVAYAWGSEYQQSNQFALETVALAADPTVRDRASAQAWLRSRDYRPTDLRLGTATRLGARLTRANVAFDDHPTARRFSGHIDTVTVDSVFEWLPRAGLGRAPELVRQ